MPYIPKKLVKTLDQMDNLDLNKLPNKKVTLPSGELFPGGKRPTRWWIDDEFGDEDLEDDLAFRDCYDELRNLGDK